MLENLTPGDKVVLKSQYLDRRYYKDTAVKNITATGRIVLVTGEVFLPSGKQYTSSKDINWKLCLPEQVEQERKAYTARQALKRINWHDLSDEVVLKVAAIISGQE